MFAQRGGIGTVLAITASCMAGGPAWAEHDNVSVSVAALRAQASAYEYGEGISKDPIRAVELYCQAARQGDAEAQYDLGWIYANGRGVMRDDSLAALFFRMAAEQGHPQARALLAHFSQPSADLPQCMRDLPAFEYDDRPIPELAAPTPQEEEVAAFVPTTAAEARVATLVQTIAPEYKVSPLLALAIIRAESNFDSAARSPKNAQGLMQLIPETSARFNVKKPYDPVQNLRGGLAYLRWLLAYFRGNVPLVAAAYNAGEGAVERYRGVPPYAETREYVRRIMSLFRRSHHPYDPTVTDPSPELERINLVTGPR